MTDLQFYPTPKTLIQKMVDAINHDGNFIDRISTTLLEPSAGNGDIVDYIKDLYKSWRHDYGVTFDIYVCEVDGNRVNTLKGKGYNVIAFDFLKSDIQYKPNVILMNPPFQNGVKHVLKAWELLRNGGRMAAILNANTLKTAFSFERKKLLEIINQYGHYKFLQNEFNDELTQRKTNVEIALIYLEKNIDEEIKYINDDYKRLNLDKDESKYMSSSVEINALIPKLLARYNASISAFKMFSQSYDELREISKPLLNRTDKIGGIDAKIPSYNEFVKNITRQSWQQIFDKTRLRDLVSKKVRGELTKKFDDCSMMAFTDDNITMLLHSLVAQRTEIYTDCVLEAYDNLTRYHYKNLEHKEGWKSNSEWMLTQKVIYPCYIDKWYDYFYISYSTKDTLDDIDRALCFIANKQLSDVVKISDLIEEMGEDKRLATFIGETTFFKVKAYKKGTLHLTFNYTLDDGTPIRDKFNYIVANVRKFPLKGVDIKKRK